MVFDIYITVYNINIHPKSVIIGYLFLARYFKNLTVKDYTYSLINTTLFLHVNMVLDKIIQQRMRYAKVWRKQLSFMENFNIEKFQFGYKI